MYCFSHVLQNILRLFPVCTISVSPSTLTKFCGPSHFFVLVRYVSTGDPAGSSRNLYEASFSFGPLLYRNPNNILLLAFYFSAAFEATSTIFSLSICVGEGSFLAGRGPAPNTRITGNIPSGPIFQLIEKTDILRHSASVVVRSRSLSYAARSGAWYHSTVPMVPEFSTGVYLNCTPFDSKLVRISLEMYANSSSTVKKSGGPL